MDRSVLHAAMSLTGVARGEREPKYYPARFNSKNSTIVDFVV